MSKGPVEPFTLEHKNTAPLLKRQKIHNACADFRGVYLNVVRVYTHMMYAVVWFYMATETLGLHLCTIDTNTRIPEILIQDQRPIEVEMNKQKKQCLPKCKKVQ